MGDIHLSDLICCLILLLNKFLTVVIIDQEPRHMSCMSQGCDWRYSLVQARLACVCVLLYWSPVEPADCRIQMQASPPVVIQQEVLKTGCSWPLTSWLYAVILFLESFYFPNSKFLEVGSQNKNKTAFYFYLHFWPPGGGGMRELIIKIVSA